MNDSSFGSAAPKTRSLNVGANLLREWTTEQARRRRQVARYAALFGASLVLGVGTLPRLIGSVEERSREIIRLRKTLAALDEQLAISDRERKAAQPALVVDAMNRRTDGSHDRLLSQLARVLGAGNARVALTSLRCDVQAGEAHLVVQADAEEDGAADAFARNAGEQGAKVDAIVNSRPSHLLAPGGIGFQYEKRIGVGE